MELCGRTYTSAGSGRPRRENRLRFVDGWDIDETQWLPRKYYLGLALLDPSPKTARHRRGVFVGGGIWSDIIDGGSGVTGVVCIRARRLSISSHAEVT